MRKTNDLHKISVHEKIEGESSIVKFFNNKLLARDLKISLYVKFAKEDSILELFSFVRNKLLTSNSCSLAYSSVGKFLSECFHLQPYATNIQRGKYLSETSIDFHSAPKSIPNR